MTTPTEAAKPTIVDVARYLLEDYTGCHRQSIERLCGYVLERESIAVPVAPVLAQPAPFRIDRPGIYQQRDWGVATVTDPPSDECENWNGHDSYGADRKWKADGTHAYGMKELDLHRYIGPLDEPAEPEPAPIEPVDRGEPVVDAAELKAKAWEIYLASIRTFSDTPELSWTAAAAQEDCFSQAHAFLTEAARREKEPT